MQAFICGSKCQFNKVLNFTWARAKTEDNKKNKMRPNKSYFQSAGNFSWSESVVLKMNNVFIEENTNILLVRTRRQLRTKKRMSKVNNNRQNKRQNIFSVIHILKNSHRFRCNDRETSKISCKWSFTDITCNDICR